MRIALLLAVLTFANACTAVSGGTEEVTMTTLGRGSYAASHSGRNAVLATSDTDYQRFWRELAGGPDAPPAVDFAENVVVFLFAGERNTGGWSVEPKSVTIEGDTAVIDAPVNGPPPGSMVTQALTYPYAVVSVRSRDVKNVRWPQ